MPTTSEQYDNIIKSCHQIFKLKMKDYGPTWRIMRPESLTDQLFIKAKRIRQIELTGENLVGDSIKSELMAIVNYSAMAIIQAREGFSDHVDWSADVADTQYTSVIAETKQLMMAKNHDYGEAWRDMRGSSLTDIILTKINRIKKIEDNNGRTEVSEGVESNYQDIINYAVFGLIKIAENEEKTNR